MGGAAENLPEATGARGAASWRLAGLALVLAIGFGARSMGAGRAFAPDGVRFAADGDTYYHALRSERLARDWPHVPWRDAGMNYPFGADVPWPPLLDQMLAAASLATGSADAEHVAKVAAWAAPVVSLAWIWLVALLGGVLLGGGAWLDAALLVALLPAAVRHGVVGRPDHHVLEATLFAAVCAAYAQALRRPSPGWAWPALLGAALALSFWNWPGSGLYLLVLAAHVAAVHLAAGPADAWARGAAATLARGAGVAAVLVGALVAIGGPPGALLRGGLTPISGLAALLCAATAASAALLDALARWRPDARLPARATRVLAAAGIPAAALALWPTGAGGIQHGLVALGASNTWFASIGEFAPSLLSGTAPWLAEAGNFLVLFGLAPLTAALAALPFRRAWRERPELRATLSFFAASSLAVVALALARRRFDVYAVAPLALGGAWTLRELAAAAARRAGGGARLARAIGLLGLVLVAAPGLPTVAGGELSSAPPGEDKIPLLRWLRGVAPPGPGREAVISEWSYGHEIQWFAGKPVISTPFGTEIDPHSIGDAAAFFLASDPQAAEALLRRRGVGFVFLSSPVEEVALLSPFAPGGLEPVAVGYGLGRGRVFHIREPFGDLVPSRLFYFDGGWPSGEGASLDAYRLVAESAERVQVLTVTAQRFKLFELVEGARLRVQADPGPVVGAVVLVRTNAGREFPWTTGAQPDAAGVATLRIPYATGANGLVVAGPCTVVQGNRARQVAVPQRAVSAGEEVPATLR